jgi:hypothetical protein
MASTTTHCEPDRAPAKARQSGKRGWRRYLGQSDSVSRPGAYGRPARHTTKGCRQQPVPAKGLSSPIAWMPWATYLGCKATSTGPESGRWRPWPTPRTRLWLRNRPVRYVTGHLAGQEGDPVMARHHLDRAVERFRPAALAALARACLHGPGGASDQKPQSAVAGVERTWAWSANWALNSSS